MKQELINIEEAIYRFPLTLKGIKNEILINQINSFLPYSTGLEIECSKLPKFSDKAFTGIPNIIDVNCDSTEQRFRIPNGIEGLICLYEICKQLKINSALNPMGGIHYHIDMTDTFHLIDEDILNENKDWILKELDNWEDSKGTHQFRDCRINNNCYINFQSSFKTAEIKIGAQSFDYSFIVKRIIDANDTIRKFKDVLLKTPNQLRLMKLKNRLEELTKNDINLEGLPSQDEMKKIINNRTIKINGRK